jgi:hypothetical protein
MRVRTYKVKKPPSAGVFVFLIVPFDKDKGVVPAETLSELGELVEFKTLEMKPGENRIGANVDEVLRQIDERGYAIERTYMGIDNLFDAALRMGYALQGRPDGLPGLHRFGQPKTPDRGRALQGFWDAVQSAMAELGLQGETPEEINKSIDVNIASEWLRTGLKNIVTARSLILKNDQTADQRALELLGEAVWEMQAADPDEYWKPQIIELWPTPPAKSEG